MFDNFFWSTSVNFKAERSWILRLLCAGLNSDDDAMIYIRNSILETLMTFYVSPLSDFESKNLIIEVSTFLKFVLFFSYLSIVVLQVVVSEYVYTLFVVCITENYSKLCFYSTCCHLLTWLSYCESNHNLGAIF